MTTGNKLPQDIPDDMDRRDSSPGAKLVMLATWVKEQTGEDPRGGGWSFIGKPEVVHALLQKLPIIMRTLAPKMAVSGANAATGKADVVAYWEGVPIRTRHNVKGTILHAIRDSLLPPSTGYDRRIAGEMRMHHWAGASS